MSAVSMMISWLLAGIVTGLDVTDKERKLGNFTREEEGEEAHVPPDHKDGGLPLISDSVFSLIIMIYVLLAFFFVFFLFCWRRGPERSLSTHKVRGCLHWINTRCVLLTSDITRPAFNKVKPKDWYNRGKQNASPILIRFNSLNFYTRIKSKSVF